MEKLGAIVVVAGRNGAGKTRLMKRLIEWQNAARHSPVSAAQLEMIRRQLEGEKSSGPRRTQLEKQLADLQTRMTAKEGVVLSEAGTAVIVPFVPNKLELSDPNAMSKQNLLQASKSVEAPGVGHLPGGSFARIQTFQDRKWEATHPSRTISEDEISTTLADYERLEQLIQRFLNSPITRSIDGEAQLFGLPLGKTALSDGQKVVLQLCIAIHAQGANLNNLIIFMDEPENHLHPAALLDLVTAVQERVGNGQLWIATHSIPLLAEVDPSAIWWMEDNSISKAGNRPEQVLTGLLGDEVRRERLATRRLSMMNSLSLPRFGGHPGRRV
jgi:ATPase subunit of ABC transporter with duplicated ATPase domains